MGRRKLEIKRIQDKSSRLVSFSKRRSGLFKKARHLSMLCDVDVAVVVFSDKGKLYEACSGSTNRYEKSYLEGEERTTQERFPTCKELLESVRRIDEEPNEVSITDMIKLVEELNAGLLHIRSKKKQLMMERISSFHEQERKLIAEKEELMQQVAAAKQKNYVGGLDDFANNDRYNYQTNPYESQQLLTLPLFTE